MRSLKNISLRGLKVFVPREIKPFLDDIPEQYRPLCNMMLHTGIGLKECMELGYNIKPWFIPEELIIYYDPKRWDSSPRVKKRVVYLAPQDVRYIRAFVKFWKKYISKQLSKHKIYSKEKIYSTMMDAMSKMFKTRAAKYCDNPEILKPSSFLATRIAWLAVAYPEHIDIIYESTRHDQLGISKQDIVDFVNSSPFTDTEIKSIINRVNGWKVTQIHSEL
jgi:hypothetical protein